QVLVRLVPVSEPRPEVDDPGPAPARVPAAVFKPMLERLARGRRQIGRSPRSDLIARVEREQVRDVAMSRVRLFVLFRPFEQSPVAPDPHRGEAVARSLQIRAELLVNAEQPRRLCAVAEEAADDLRV